MSDAELLTRAALAAAEAHKGQTRKGGEVPYVNHVIEVAHLVAEAGGTPEMVAAAFLHDTVEDSDATRRRTSRRTSALHRDARGEG
jgi:(p)ppGpp synthase/HD superfamily hydrolase